MFNQFETVEELIATAAREKEIILSPEDVEIHNGDLFVDGMNAEEWLDAM